MSLYMKTYKRRAGLLVAVCDADLIGKTLKDGDLDVNISTHFYKGEPASVDAVLKAIKAAFSGNFFGKEAIKVAVKAGVISREGVKKIAGIPHAQFVRMDAL